jgi:hypothetical protein
VTGVWMSRHPAVQAGWLARRRVSAAARHGIPTPRVLDRWDSRSRRTRRQVCVPYWAAVPTAPAPEITHAGTTRPTHAVPFQKTESRGFSGCDHYDIWFGNIRRVLSGRSGPWTVKMPALYRPCVRTHWRQPCDNWTIPRHEARGRTAYSWRRTRPGSPPG